MTFRKWYFAEFFDKWKNKDVDPYDVAQTSWIAGQKLLLKEATEIIRWLDEKVKSGADDYEGSDEVERFLSKYDM